MMKRLLPLITLLLLTAGCTTFSGIGTDNNPKPASLASITPEVQVVQLWSQKPGIGSGDQFLRLAPAYRHPLVFTADKAGRVSAVNANTGKTVWVKETKMALTSSPAAGKGKVLIGSQSGQVIALNDQTGKELWETTVPGEVLATPTLDETSAYIKTVDGNICALNLQTGKIIWSATHDTPLLILRGSSAPQIFNNLLLAGFADGKLIAFEKNTGQLIWEKAIALPQGTTLSERMIDIDIQPAIKDNVAYVATYQGNVAAVKVQDGSTVWEHPVSSYAGLTLDNKAVYISSADSHIWAFDRHNGHVLWKQNKLYARRITGPVLMNNALVIGDAEGYLHWLGLEDGHFIGRTAFDKTGIIANPIVENNTLFVTAINGSLAAYQVKPISTKLLP